MTQLKKKKICAVDGKAKKNYQGVIFTKYLPNMWNSEFYFACLSL